MISSSTQEKQRKYARITTKQKKTLIQLVFQFEWKIITASIRLGIKYATAKNIIVKYRKDVLLRKPFILNNTKRCGFREWTGKETNIFIVVSHQSKLIKK